MKSVISIKARTVVLPTRDIDTDQIIAARFLTTTSRDGLGKNVFYDLRYHRDGSIKPEFVLNKPEASACTVLVGGNNFGCGSSREHAPWALLDYGFEVVISTEIADIFRNNSLKNGLLPVVVNTDTHQWLLEHPGVELCFDIPKATMTLPDGTVIPFDIDGFSQHCLIEGVDQLGFLQKHSPAIKLFEEERRWKP